jgi:hypothetical protein
LPSDEHTTHFAVEIKGHARREKNVMQEKDLHNLLKSNGCKFTKIIIEKL